MIAELHGKDRIMSAYGWSDMDLGHGFHATKQGERCTLREPARRAVLDRLLALKHQSYGEEAKARFHNKGAKTGKAQTPRVGLGDGHGELFSPTT
jgi:hypothetical protein